MNGSDSGCERRVYTGQMENQLLVQLTLDPTLQRDDSWQLLYALKETGTMESYKEIMLYPHPAPHLTHKQTEIHRD